MNVIVFCLKREDFQTAELDFFSEARQNLEKCVRSPRHLHALDSFILPAVPEHKRAPPSPSLGPGPQGIWVSVPSADT